MRIIQPSFEILNKEHLKDMPKLIERVARTCYRTENRITDNSYKKMIQNLIDRGHEAMIEFGDIIVRFICDRGVSHELVRHRLASFAQESTRYCNYELEKFGSEITVIDLATGFKYDLNNPVDAKKYEIWQRAMSYAESCYFEMMELGAKPQEARSVLPNSLKTEINMKMDFRCWRNFFNLRIPSTAHPQMRQLITPFFCEVKTIIPIIFDDIEVEE